MLTADEFKDVYQKCIKNPMYYLTVRMDMTGLTDEMRTTIESYLMDSDALRNFRLIDYKTAHKSVIWLAIHNSYHVLKYIDFNYFDKDFTYEVFFSNLKNAKDYIKYLNYDTIDLAKLKEILVKTIEYNPFDNVILNINLDYFDDEYVSLLKNESLKRNGMLIKHFDKPTHEMCLNAIKNISHSIQHINFKEMDINLVEEIYMKAVKQNGDVLSLINFQHNHSKDFMYKLYEEAIKSEPQSIKHICFDKSERSKNIILKALKAEPDVIRDVKINEFDEKTIKEFYLCAVQHNGMCLEYIPDEFKSEFTKVAIQQNGNAIKYVYSSNTDPTEDLCIKAIKQNPEAIFHIDKPSTKVCIFAIEQDIELFYAIKHEAINDEIIEHVKLLLMH